MQQTIAEWFECPLDKALHAVDYMYSKLLLLVFVKLLAKLTDGHFDNIKKSQNYYFFLRVNSFVLKSFFL